MANEKVLSVGASSNGSRSFAVKITGAGEQFIVSNKGVAQPTLIDGEIVVCGSRGKFSFVNTSSEEFARRKAQEIELEDRR